MRQVLTLIVLLISMSISSRAQACKLTALGGSQIIFRGILEEVTRTEDKGHSVERIQKIKSLYEVRLRGPLGCKDLKYDVTVAPECTVAVTQKSSKACK